MYIGKSIVRGEDSRLLRGEGSFTDDIQLAGQTYAAFVRSTHASAAIRHIDCSAARAADGVLQVLTAEDWQAAGLGALPCAVDVPCGDGSPMKSEPRPVFAHRRACHVGDTLAAVIAHSPGAALDAAELVDVDYEPLEAVVDPRAALGDGAPLVHPRFGTNLATWAEAGDAEATRRAFARAHHATELEYRHNRVSANPMEPRAYVAAYDAGRDRYTLWAAGQNPHLLQRLLAREVLRIPMNRLRVICPDVGGGFGIKYYCYPEQAVVLAAARLIGRPVRWTASRSESMLSDTHGRDHFNRAAMAFDAGGRILGLRCHSIQAYGAYQSTYSPVILMQSLSSNLTGMYRIAAGHLRVDGVYTHTPPVDAYRGTKQAGAYIAERLIEQAARELGADPVELRRRNYLRASDYPHTTLFGSSYDSGDPARQHDTLAGIADYAALRAERGRPRADGQRLGVGLAAVVESTGMGPSREMGGKLGGWEYAQVRVNPDGRVRLYAGTHSHGQSHEITFRQLAADELGVPIEDIEFVQGDTEMGPGNLGTAAARALSTAGMGLAVASRRVIAKCERLAAHMLECAAEDLEYAQGRFAITGTDRGVGFDEVVEMAYTGASYPEQGFEPGLEETVAYDPLAWGYPTALNLAVVLVDVETGAVRIRDYCTVDDCGRVINPMIVHGQVHGGVAQGIGQVLLEEVVFDTGSGQLLSGSFVDYAMPRADHLPALRVAFQETLNPNNELGVKGCSETGVVAAPAAIGNAVLDALWPLGVRHLEMPLTPERVWRAIRAAG